MSQAEQNEIRGVGKAEVFRISRDAYQIPEKQ